MLKKTVKSMRKKLVALRSTTTQRTKSRKYSRISTASVWGSQKTHEKSKFSESPNCTETPVIESWEGRLRKRRHVPCVNNVSSKSESHKRRTQTSITKRFKKHVRGYFRYNRKRPSATRTSHKEKNGRVGEDDGQTSADNSSHRRSDNSTTCDSCVLYQGVAAQRFFRVRSPIKETFPRRGRWCNNKTTQR